MTREEREKAINILEEVKQLDDSIYQYNTKYLEALDMAIEALEQEPILDKIRAEIMMKDGLEEALEIIDKYKAESEE